MFGCAPYKAAKVLFYTIVPAAASRFAVPQLIGKAQVPRDLKSHKVYDVVLGRSDAGLDWRRGGDSNPR